MINELKAELVIGKKIYLFELISIILFSVFLGVGVNVEWLNNNVFVANSIVIGWLLINTVVISVYAIYAFIGLLFKEQSLTTHIGRTILYKVFLFIFWFAINSFIFMQASGMAIPIITLGLTFLILAYTKDIFPSKVGLMIAGILWFGVLFIIFYLGYPILFVVLNAIIPNITVITVVMNVLFIGLGMIIFWKVIKKTHSIYNS